MKYQEFLSKFEEVLHDKKDEVYFVMNTLQTLAEEKNFHEFQEILDEADPAKFGDAAYTIGLVAWWYGDKLDRKTYVEKGVAHYNKLKGGNYGTELFEKIAGKGGWKPTFGFEKKLFGINE